jgi:hypothetical protein
VSSSLLESNFNTNEYVSDQLDITEVCKNNCMADLYWDDCRLPHHKRIPEKFLTKISENFPTKIPCTLFFSENSSSERRKTLGWQRWFLVTGLDRGLGMIYILKE